MHYVILDMIFTCIYAWHLQKANDLYMYLRYPERKNRLMLNEEENSEENLFGISF